MTQHRQSSTPGAFLKRGGHRVGPGSVTGQCATKGGALRAVSELVRSAGWSNRSPQSSRDRSKESRIAPLIERLRVG
jgi:hypothetical protein